MADSRPQPRWSGPATVRADELATQFKTDLRSLAVRAARYDDATIVEHKHVQAASLMLRDIGLRNRPWYKRGELFGGIGLAALFWGLLTQTPDVRGAILPAGPKKEATIYVVVVAFAVLGVVSLALGISYRWLVYGRPR